MTGISNVKVLFLQVYVLLFPVVLKDTGKRQENAQNTMTGFKFPIQIFYFLYHLCVQMSFIYIHFSRLVETL